MRQALPAHRPLSLRDAPGQAWRVVDGAVDLFSMAPNGPRTHLVRRVVGDIFVAPRDWLDDIDIVAVGTVEAIVESVGHAAGDDLAGWRQALRDDRPADDLDAVHRALLQRLRDGHIDARAAEQRGLTRRLERDAHRFQGSLVRLQAVLLPSAPLAEDEDTDRVEEDVLSATCRLVVDALGVDVPPPVESPPDADTLADPVRQIARRWRLRTRQIRLGENWFRHDCGPCIGFLREGGTPVALLPRGRLRYDLVDLARNKHKPVTAAVAATLEPRAYIFYRPLPQEPVDLETLVRFGLRGNVRDLQTVVLTLIGGGMLGTVVPIMTGILVSTVIPSASRSELAQLIIGLLWTMIAIAMFSLVQSTAMNRVEQNMEAPLQAALWDRLLSLPVGFFRQYAAGDLANRAMGISAMRQALTGAALTSLLSVVMSFFNLGLLFFYSGTLALAACLLLLAQSVVFVWCVRLQVQRQRRVTEVQGRLSGLLLQLFGGIARIRVAGAERRAYVVWAQQYATQSELMFASRRISGTLATFDAFWTVFASLVLYAIVAYGARLSTGAFLAFTASFATFMTAFVAMNNALASVIAAIPSYERARPILDAVPEVDRVSGHAPILEGGVELSHVQFRYRNQERTSPLILNDVTLSAAAGEFIAIVGPSGSGKSTIFRLLLGFETPDAGSIFYDGESLDHLDVAAVRSQMGVVLQNGQLITGDIFTNIVGARNLTLDDAWRAAEMAGLAEDIRLMPMGMGTVISEGATNLSGGQRQRLLIARAVVANPKVLLFDEATSALDNETQKHVSDAIRTLPATRIVIAHRLSTVQDADRIYVVADTRVVESGNFDQLMAAGGLFYQLARRQLS